MGNDSSAYFCYGVDYSEKGVNRMESVANGSITFQQLVGFGIFILALIAAYNTIMTAVKNHREEKRRKDAPVSTLDNIVKEHEGRIKRADERLDELEEANRIQMRALMAMLHHAIDGNSTDGLKKSYDEIQQYLIDK
jgi:hypothetical protein